MPNRNDAIRGRLRERLVELGHPEGYTWLAEHLGLSRTQVWKWTTGDTEAFPAAFAMQLQEHGIVSAHWLLTGEGPHAPVAPDAEQVAYRKIVAIVRQTDPTSLPGDGHVLREGAAVQAGESEIHEPPPDEDTTDETG